APNTSRARSFNIGPSGALRRRSRNGRRHLWAARLARSKSSTEHLPLVVTARFISSSTGALCSPRSAELPRPQAAVWGLSLRLVERLIREIDELLLLGPIHRISGQPQRDRHPERSLFG